MKSESPRFVNNSRPAARGEEGAAGAGGVGTDGGTDRFAELRKCLGPRTIPGDACHQAQGPS